MTDNYKRLLNKYIELTNRDKIYLEDLQDFESLFEQEFHFLEFYKAHQIIALQIAKAKSAISFKRINFHTSFATLSNEMIEALAKPIDTEIEHRISKESIVEALNHLIIMSNQFRDEYSVERHLYTYLSGLFGRENIHQQYSIGGFLGLKVDLDIENGKYGIEIKLADKLNASDMQRLIGQVVYYRNRVYQDNLVLFILSRNDLDATWNELIRFVRTLGVEVIYKKAVRQK